MIQIRQGDIPRLQQLGGDPLGGHRPDAVEWAVRVCAGDLLGMGPDVRRVIGAMRHIRFTLALSLRRTPVEGIEQVSYVLNAPGVRGPNLTKCGSGPTSRLPTSYCG